MLETLVQQDQQDQQVMQAKRLLDWGIILQVGRVAMREPQEVLGLLEAEAKADLEGLLVLTQHLLEVLAGTVEALEDRQEII
jgi:hypothetical protein